MRVWSMVLGLMLLGCDSEKAPGASRYYERGQLAPHALISTPKEVDCQLSDGTDSRCMQFHFKSNTVEAGPYCPKNLSEVGGLAYYDGDTNPGLQPSPGISCFPWSKTASISSPMRARCVLAPPVNSESWIPPLPTVWMPQPMMILR